MTWHAFVILGVIAGLVEVVAAIQNAPEINEPEQDESAFSQVKRRD